LSGRSADHLAGDENISTAPADIAREEINRRSAGAVGGGGRRSGLLAEFMVVGEAVNSGKRVGSFGAHQRASPSVVNNALPQSHLKQRVVLLDLLPQLVPKPLFCFESTLPSFEFVLCSSAFQTHRLAGLRWCRLKHHGLRGSLVAGSRASIL